ncbi:hypothetical protein CVT24_007282 [Panaeolus cyanescens]|uniref:Uncharacterized protein n=1 Tax=Panaeolus cyanescens TaxID=181874 RepID=A0A409VJ13_9AGAR|nr:hypothetical protein CVT24_007282 [Panaeolus cyanescens]
MPTQLSQENSAQPTHENSSESSQSEDDEEQQFSQRQLKKKFKKSKDTSGIVFKPYLNTSAWLQRSYAMDLIWAGILTRGIAWDFKIYTPFTKPQYEEKFRTQILHYNTLMESVPSMAEDREKLRGNSQAIELLGANMVDSANQARSNDIFGLKDKFLQYLALELPSGAAIPTKPDKSDRGFKNRYTAELLVPGILRSQFDKDPNAMMAELLNGTPQYLDNNGNDDREVPINEEEFPSFMWPEGGFVAGPENCEVNLLRSNILVRIYRHIFTTPSSALKNLNDTITKSVKGMAKKEKMQHVTPASIAYACVMLRHAATCATSWDQHDRSFNYQKYFSIVVALFDKSDEDADIEWIDDTLKWWDVMIFGTESASYDGADNPKKRRATNSTLEDIKRLRRAKKQRRIETREAEAARIPESSSIHHSQHSPASTQHSEPFNTSPTLSRHHHEPSTSPEQPVQSRPRPRPLESIGGSSLINSQSTPPPPPPNQLARAPRLAQSASQNFAMHNSPRSSHAHTPIDPALHSSSFFHQQPLNSSSQARSSINQSLTHQLEHDYSLSSPYTQNRPNAAHNGHFEQNSRHRDQQHNPTAHSSQYYDENTRPQGHYPPQRYE